MPVNLLFLLFSRILGFVLQTYRPYGTKEHLFGVFYKHIVPTGLKKESTSIKTNKIPCNCETIFYKQLFSTTRYILLTHTLIFQSQISEQVHKKLINPVLIRVFSVFEKPQFQSCSEIFIYSYNLSHKLLNSSRQKIQTHRRGGSLCPPVFDTSYSVARHRDLTDAVRASGVDSALQIIYEIRSKALNIVTTKSLKLTFKSAKFLY